LFVHSRWCISFICLVECIGFEFKFGLNSIRFVLFRNRKEKEKTENPNQPKNPETQTQPKPSFRAQFSFPPQHAAQPGLLPRTLSPGLTPPAHTRPAQKSPATGPGSPLPAQQPCTSPRAHAPRPASRPQPASPSPPPRLRPTCQPVPHASARVSPVPLLGRAHESGSSPSSRNGRAWHAEIPGGLSLSGSDAEIPGALL